MAYICPICNSDNGSPVSSSIFIKCLDCGVIFNTGYKALPYDDKYYIEDYQGQYGKTYEEDFENIYNRSSERLYRIISLWKKKNKKEIDSLLDIGSALGFFLKCAQDNGVNNLYGLEISAFASDFMKMKYNFNVISSSFEDYIFKKKYDVVSAWYFIEHSKDPMGVLKKCFSLINENGVFAFSMPSFYGPLYSKNLDKWIETHPVDHLIDISPKSITNILKKIGFKKVIIYPASIHPERFILKKSWLYPVLSGFFKIYSKIFAFSDTIEVYAIK